MPLHRLPLLVACLGAVFAATPACAQTYPSRPIEVVIHTGPGSGSDLFTRVVADTIAREKLLPQPLVLVNKGGGGGAIAFSYVAGRRADPYTLLAVATTVLLTSPVRSGLDLGLDKFTPLALFGFDVNCIAVREDAPYATLKDLIEAARREPNTIVLATGAFGGTGHYLVHRLEKATGAKFKTVSMKNGNEAVLAVLGGHVMGTAENLSEMAVHVEAKKMRVLGVPTAQRLQEAPDIPTLREQGIDLRIGVGRGFAAPADVPRDAVTVLQAALHKAYQSVAWQDYARKNMYENVYMSGPEFARYLAERQAEMAQFMADSGLIKRK